MMFRTKVAQAFAKSGKSKPKAIGKGKVSNGGVDITSSGEQWNSELGTRPVPPRPGEIPQETEYVGPQSAGYNSTSRTVEKLGFDMTPILIGASSGAGIGGAIFKHKRAPLYGALAGAALSGIGAAVSEIQKRRRDKMIARWATHGVPTRRRRGAY